MRTSAAKFRFRFLPSAKSSLLILVLGVVTAVRAQIVVVGENENTTHPATKFTFSFNSTNNQLTVDIDNYLSKITYGTTTGTLTSFGFDVPADLLPPSALAPSILTITGFEDHAASFVPSSAWAFTTSYQANPNVVHLNFGAITGANGAGGDPNDGLWYGEMAQFVFQFNPTVSGPFSVFPTIAEARWQEVGINLTEGRNLAGFNGGSDYGDGEVPIITPPPIIPVPEPSTYGLMGVIALAGVAALKRRRRSPGVPTS